MGFLEVARDTLRDLQVTDAVRERLSFAFDRLADAESKIEVLQKENGKFQAQLEREQLDHKQARQELQRLKDEHAEETLIHCQMEFRRGKHSCCIHSASV